MISPFTSPRLASACAVAALLAAGPLNAQIQFEDVSSDAGFTGFTESWGSSWGDFNTDGWPDIFVQGHRDFPRAYRNTATGEFQDIALEIDTGRWIADTFDDQHGVAFADFDNDGDDDLLLAVSVTGDGQLLVNEGGDFVDRTTESGLGDDADSRHSLWFDYTGDGLLDVAQFNTSNAFLRFRDPADAVNPLFDFDPDVSNAFDCPGRLNYGQLLDVDGDSSLELICIEEGPFPTRIWDVSTTPFTDTTISSPVVGNVNDTALADLNNDLLNDIVLTRGAVRRSGASLAGPNRLEAWLRKPAGPAGKSIFFESNGEISVTVDQSFLTRFDDADQFTLSPTTITSADSGPVRIEWVAVESRWRVWLTVTGDVQAYVQIDTVEPVTNVVEDGLDTPEFAQEINYLQNNGVGPGTFSRVLASGLELENVFCSSVVTADFDNDMDQDIYMVCGRGPENLRNRVYENQGDGTFVEVLSHGGEGPVGTGFAFGVGESVTTGDYDVDGFVDLFITNGMLFYPIGVGGPDTLLRNVGNANNWIEIDLVGTMSNRDGVGARVTLTAGGVTQLREQNGGYHRWSQNDQRLHFGLADNTAADITITWPSGVVDTFTAVSANTLYTATEGGSVAPVTLGPPVFTELEAGDECGEPGYTQDYGPAVLLWKDCTTDLWSLRAKGGRFGDFRNFVGGEIRGDAPFSDVAPFGLVSDDSLDNTTPETVVFSVGVWFANDQGFDFSTAAQTESCFDPTTLDMPLIFGGNGKLIEPPFDLLSLGECAPPPPVDPACGNPWVGPATDNGLFIWRACNQPGPDGQWRVTAAGGGIGAGAYPGVIFSETAILSGTGVKLEPGDTLDTVPGDGTLDFILELAPIGIDSFNFVLPAGADACFGAGDLPGSAQVRLGVDRTIMTGPFDLNSGVACVLPEPDPACGNPGLNPALDNELQIWRDCTIPGPDTHWRVRVASAGQGPGRYAGVVFSDNGTLTATPAFLEANDTLDTVPNDGTLDFELLLGTGAGVDGFDFVVPAGANACFATASLPFSAQVQLGIDGVIKTGAFDLATGEACIAPPPPALDPTCGFPAIDPAVDNALFVWRACSAGDNASWNVRATAGGVGAGNYAGVVTGTAPVLSAAPVVLESNDVLDTVVGDNVIDFDLQLGATSVDGFTFTLPSGTTACFDAAALPAGAQVTLGAGRVVVAGAFDLRTAEPCN